MNRYNKLALGACVAIAGAAAQAQTLIDTIGPGDAFAAHSGWIAGLNGAVDYQQYSAFTPTVSGLAGTVRAAIKRLDGPMGGVALNIRADNNGLPGELLAFGVASTGPDYSIVSAQLNTPLQLNSGEHYWFGLSVLSQGSQVALFDSPLVIPGIHAGGDVGQSPIPWFNFAAANTSAFAISAVPNPPTYAMLGFGLLALAVAGQRRRQGSR